MGIFGPVVSRYGKERFNLRQKLALLVMDVLLLAELCCTMYIASNAGDMFSAVFMRTYLPMFFPTAIGGIWLSRRLRDPREATDIGSEAEAGQQI
ncbi:MAG: hypothetical protein R6W92_00905 [Desulfocurvibacter africanus]